MTEIVETDCDFIPTGAIQTDVETRTNIASPFEKGGLRGFAVVAQLTPASFPAPKIPPNLPLKREEPTPPSV